MTRAPISILIFATLMLSGCGSAQSQIPTADVSSLEDSLKNIKSHSQIPGFVVAVVKHSIMYAKGFGYSNIKEKRLYTTGTIQPIASISKTFIGLALMKAIE